MATFESMDRRMPKIEACLKANGLESLDACNEMLLAKGIDCDKIVRGVQPICFDNAVWAYTLGTAIAVKRGLTDAAECAAAIGEGLEAFTIQSQLVDVALGQLQITDALLLGGEDGAGHGAQALAQVVQTCADGQTVLRESGLAAAVDDLQEQLAHCHVDGVAHQVGVQSFQNGLAGQDLACHSSRVGHAGAADGLHQSLLDDTVLDVQRQLAGALLGCTPAHTMGVAADVLDLLGLNPLALFGNGSGAMVCALGDGAHILYFCTVNHGKFPFFQKTFPSLGLLFRETGT